MTAKQFVAARNKLGLSQKAMAEALGMGTHGWQAISGWENGKHPVPATTALAVKYLLEKAA